MTRHLFVLRQLSLLVAIHFSVDMLSGTLPGILPALRQKYALSLVAGTVLLTLCSFSSNGIQLWAGTLRKTARRPKLIQLGMLLACAICIAGLAPQAGAFAFLIVLTCVHGGGVGLAHPEGLRCVCAIPESSVTSGVATSLFMLAGFTGYATGPLVAAGLVETFGFPGLYFLLIPSGVLLWLFSRSGLRLARDHAPGGENVARGAKKAASPAPSSALAFRELFLLAVFLNAGCGIMQGLLPSYMEELGFSLSFGGLAVTLFGLGSGFGALVTGFLAKRRRVLPCLSVELAAGIPLLVLYLALAGSRGAVCLAPLTGVLVGAGFPQLVALARTARSSLALGTRLGMIVGGSWGVAGIMLLLVGVAGKYFMLKTAMFFAPACFAAALVMLLFLGKRNGGRAVSVQR